MATQSLSPEMTSYARLCLAINDVCTKSFRDVLLCSVPNKDIKQAIKAHWGPHYNSPMLKKYPYSNFFPNHQLDPNFSVSDCDMSLLYSLIRNVSSVQQPSLGWGQSCWNNPLDTSIGANVERLHELRNTVIHLQEPRLSNQEFNSYWNKLRGCVTVIDTYLGGTTYQEKLECLKTDDMDPECANRLIGTFRSSLQDLQAGQLEQDKTLYNIGEKLNQGFQDNKIADDRMIEDLSEVKDLIKEDNRQLSQTAEHVKELKDRFEVIHKLMEGKAKENDKTQTLLNSDHGERTENTTSNQGEHENRVEKIDVDKSSRSESLAVQVQLKTNDVFVKEDHDNNGGIEIGDLASGQDGKLCIIKQYAFIKSSLTRESGLVIAKCLLEQKLLSQNAFDRMENTCCARSYPTDILLKKVIHGGKEEIVEAFFKRLKVECPSIARAVKDTTITEMDRLRFSQLEARGVDTGGLFRTMWCVTNGPDVRFFKYHLSESEEDVEHITDVMLSRLHFSIQDHSSIIDCPTSNDRISVLFQKMQLYKLDVVKELLDVVKPELHQKWMEFRSTQDPWWSGLFQWMKQSRPVIDGSFEFEEIELKEVETGSIIWKFIAGVNFSVDLLKPESLKNKIKILLKRGCLESKTELKSIAHITVYIESLPNKDREEIHIYIDFHATDVSIEAEDHQDKMRIRNRDIMLEEMNPARLKQWMLDQPCIQKSHRDMLESKLSEKGLFRQEEMTVLLDFINGLENGDHLLEKYCEKNDLYVYNKVFRKLHESHSQQEISGHRAAVKYVKGGGLQELFSFSIIFNDEDLASGQDGKLCITKKYAFIKSNLTKENGLVIAKCLLEQKLLSQDAFDRMGNTCCARRHLIDILLKKVIHGGKEEIVEAFFKRLKVECPSIARAVKDTTITEMDRLRFAQLEARGVETGGLFRTMCCVTSGPDVRFFKYHLSESEEDVEHITDVMLSRLHFSIQDHSSIIDCPTSNNRISALFQKMQLYELDVVKELSDVVKPELHQKWMEFRSTQETCQAHEVYESNGSKQPAHKGETLTQTDKMTELTDHTGQIHLCESDLTKSNEFQASLRKRVLPSGKTYHVFFCYAVLDIEWVRETVHTLETDYGFVCCEYDRDNTPGTPVLQFISDSMNKAYKTVIVMTKKAFQSRNVVHEIQMAMNRDFSNGKTFVVPVLLEDCEIPDYLSVLHYIDARDSKRRDIWLPKLVMELDVPGAEKITSDKIKELIQRVKEGGPKAYEMFKDCLVETKQTTLPEQLEHQEAEFQSHGNRCGICDEDVSLN